MNQSQKRTHLYKLQQEEAHAKRRAPNQTFQSSVFGNVDTRWVINNSEERAHTKEQEINEWCNDIWPGGNVNALQYAIVEYLVSNGWSLAFMARRVREIVVDTLPVPTDNREFARLAAALIRSIQSSVHIAVPKTLERKNVPGVMGNAARLRTSATWRERTGAPGKRYTAMERNKAPRGDQSARLHMMRDVDEGYLAAYSIVSQ